jgi:hypothetical protein
VLYTPGEIPESLLFPVPALPGENPAPDLPPLPLPEEAVASGPEEPSEIRSLDSATIRDDGEKLPFAVDEETSKPGLARRRGAAARRKRYTTARHTHRTERQSIDDMLREGKARSGRRRTIGKKAPSYQPYHPGRYLHMPTVEHGVSRDRFTPSELVEDIILKHRDRFPAV